ncbi:hypothetical protein BU17DRAFT_92627 [Hysterangium stoloniferum]|nr:hypothetical protein BU17DRAFT_92627 [Hysterangium stoloniferum]
MASIDGHSSPSLRSRLTLMIPQISKHRRSLSNSSANSHSRSGTPTPSTALSTPYGVHSPPFSSPSELTDAHNPPSHFAMAFHFVSEYLTPRDIILVSSTSPQCHGLRTAFTFRNWIKMNDWDIDALIRRIEEAENFKGKPWLYLARSAIRKDEILDRYRAMQEQAASGNKLLKKSTAVFMQILVDIVTEHESENFPALIALAKKMDMTFLQFVTTIPADNWKIRYQKTFLMAAYVNTQPLYPYIEQDVADLLEGMNFKDVSTSPAFQAARDNSVYTFACLTWTDVPPLPLPSLNYDPPYHSLSFRSWSVVPGLRQAAERYKYSTPVKGTYRKANEEESKMTMQFEPKVNTKALANKLSLPFTDQHLALTATVSDDKGNPPWEMEGSVNLETGRGTMKSPKGMVYHLRTTPWGIVGEKILREKHLGYFVLQWTS